MKLIRDDLVPLLESLRGWLSNANIVGVDIDLKQTGGVETAEWAVVVYVIKKKKPEELTSADFRIPSDVALHRPLADGGFDVVQVLTDVVESGPAILQSNHQRLRPCPGGMQIQPEGFNWLGTLGANVIWGGRLRLLSNNHVISNNGALADALVYQPDDSAANNALANVAGFIPVQTYPNRNQLHPFANEQDLAWCNIAPEMASHDVKGIGKINGIRNPVIGERVRVMGARTGMVKEATIKSLSASLVMEFDTGQWAWWKNLIRLSAAVTQAGDSGAVYVNDDNYIVGIHFAGNDNASFGCIL